MPFDSVSGCDGTKVCPDPACKGHEPRRVGVELRVRSWTEQVGSGPVRISRSERQPIAIAEVHKTCEFCGAANVVENFWNDPGSRALHWPVPALPGPGVSVAIDVVRPGPAPELSLEERVAKLEEATA
jgi:hypothetical protein